QGDSVERDRERGCFGQADEHGAERDEEDGEGEHGVRRGHGRSGTATDHGDGGRQGLVESVEAVASALREVTLASPAPAYRKGRGAEQGGDVVAEARGLCEHEMGLVA